MKLLMQRHATPFAVLGVALYLGWPPPSALDDGNDVVRAKAVRWRPTDLHDPPGITAAVDPFREVLVASETTIVEPETGKLVTPTKPSGPPVSELESGLRLEGIARMAGRTWAIINGRPRLAGDDVATDDANRHRCEIVAVQTGKVIVRCEETTAVLRPRRLGLVGTAASERATETVIPAATSPTEIPPPAGA